MNISQRTGRTRRADDTISALDKTEYHDNDDDDEEFDDAVEEEREDQDMGGNTAFLVARDFTSNDQARNNQMFKSCGLYDELDDATSHQETVDNRSYKSKHSTTRFRGY